MRNISKLVQKGSELSFRVAEPVVGRDREDEAEEPGDNGEDDPSKDDISSDSSLELPDNLDDDEESDIDDSDVDETDELRFDEFKVLDDDLGDKPDKRTKKPIRNHPKTQVDDQFFKLREMEEFLQREEQQEGKLKPETEEKDEDEEEDAIDLFENVNSDDEVEVQKKLG